MAVFWLLTFSQTILGGEPARNPGQPEPRLSGELFRVTTETIGSPYFYDHWSPGIVVLASGSIIDDHLLMYNGLIDELIFQHPLTYEIVIANTDFILEFKLKSAGREDNFINIRNSRWAGLSLSGNYYRVLYEGTASLLVHQKVKKSGEVAEYTAEGPRIRAKVEPDPAYYIFLGNEKSFLIRRFNRRTFFRIFPENREEVRQAFRNSGGRTKQDIDRAELTRNLDNLIY